MSFDIFENFELEKAEDMAAKEKLGKCIPSMAPTVANERRQLSDISNTGILPPLMKNKENSCLEQLNKCEESHLHEEIGSLKKQLAEIEATIVSENNEKENLWFNFCHASQQNRELVQNNTQLVKELSIDREKLKLLLHDHRQMSSMYTIKIMELQQKVTELSQEVESMQETRNKEPRENQDKWQGLPKRTSSGKMIHLFGHDDSSKEPDSRVKNNESSNERNTNGKKICLRRRSDDVSYKEPSLLTKLRQEEEKTTSSRKYRHSHSYSGQGAVERICDNAMLDVSGSLQHKTKLECAIDSKESSRDLQSSSDCTKKTGQTSDVKLQHQQQTDQSSCKESLNTLIDETQPSRRSSTGRPARKAKEIVTSYKEVPLKIKLRRSE